MNVSRDLPSSNHEEGRPWILHNSTIRTASRRNTLGKCGRASDLSSERIGASSSFISMKNRSWRRKHRFAQCWSFKISYTVDWVGEYPYEVAKPEEIVGYYKTRGFSLRRLKCVCDMGCNECVFRKDA